MAKIIVRPFTETPSIHVSNFDHLHVVSHLIDFFPSKSVNLETAIGCFRM